MNSLSPTRYVAVSLLVLAVGASAQFPSSSLVTNIDNGGMNLDPDPVFPDFQTTVLDTDVKDVYDVQFFIVPQFAVVEVVGSRPLTVKASGTVMINGILDVSGKDGVVGAGTPGLNLGGAGGPGGGRGGHLGAVLGNGGATGLQPGLDGIGNFGGAGGGNATVGENGGGSGCSQSSGAPLGA